MATSFVYSGAAGANTGASWTDAWTSLASATGVAAGDVVKVHKAHSQTALAAELNFSNGTLSNPVNIICVDKDASDALATGAVVGFNATNLGFNGSIYVYGITEQTSGAVLRNRNAASLNQVYEQCILKCTGATGIQFGDAASGNQVYKLINTSIDLSGASASGVAISLSNMLAARIEMYGGTITCRSTQTNLFTLGTRYFTGLFFGVNISGTVTNIFNSAATSIADLRFESCVAPTYTNVFSTAPTQNLCRVRFNGFMSGTITTALLAPSLLVDVTGTVDATTARYRTGGANDNSQSNAFSWEMISNSNANPFFAEFEGQPITRWVGTGSQTITVYVASGVTLNNNECWIEVLSPSEAGSATAQSTLRSTRMAPLATPAALTTDGTSTWNGSGVGTKQKMSVTINPTVPGFVVVRPHLAKASTTIYVDPVIDVAGDVNGYSRMGEGVQQFSAITAGGGGGAYILGC